MISLISDKKHEKKWYVFYNRVTIRWMKMQKDELVFLIFLEKISSLNCDEISKEIWIEKFYFFLELEKQKINQLTSDLLWLYMYVNFFKFFTPTNQQLFCVPILRLAVITKAIDQYPTFLYWCFQTNRSTNGWIAI